MSPNPETIFTTPGGKPAYWINYATLKAVKGVCSAVFITTEQPAARAGPNFQACIKMGKFHGIICPTTPTGYLFVYAKNGPFIFIVWPLIFSGHPP